MREAMTALHLDPATQLRVTQDPTHSPHVERESRGRETILKGTFLRDILLKGFRKGTESSPVDEDQATSSSYSNNFFTPDALITSWAKRYSRPDPVRVEGDPELEGLNDTQIRAVAVMLGGGAGLDGRDGRAGLVHGVCFAISEFLSLFIPSIAPRYRENQDYHRGRAAHEAAFPGSVSHHVVHVHQRCSRQSRGRVLGELAGFHVETPPAETTAHRVAR